MKTELHEFQKQGVKLLKKFEGRALLADEMGLGKTIQSLAFAERYVTGGTLVICPAYLKLNWENEARLHAGQRAHILDGQTPIKPTKLTKRRKLTIVNYDVLSHWENYIRWLNPELVIIDEFQFIKEPKTLRCKSTKNICIQAKYVIGLSGTPIENRPIELFTILQIVRPGMFKSRHAFGIDFCAAKRDRWGWNYKGASNLNLLHDKLIHTCMIRRKKSQVLKELPDKTRSIIPIGMNNDQFKEYVHAEEDFLNWVSTNIGSAAAQTASKAKQITQMTYLKKLAGSFKLQQAILWIDQFLESSEKNKLVVFGHHRNLLESLETHYKKNSVLITGKTPTKQRHIRKNQFQNDSKTKLFIGNMKAAGTGLTLTAASTMLFVELGWTPGGHNQCEDRIHRIGQKNAAQIFYMIMKGTIEDSLVKLLHEKQKHLDAAIDGLPEAESFDVWKKLIEHYQKKANKHGKSR